MCETCAALIEAVTLATQRHIAAVAKLQVAIIRHNSQAAKVLERAVRQARAERERCTLAYRSHEALHQLEWAGVSA